MNRNAARVALLSVGVVVVTAGVGSKGNAYETKALKCGTPDPLPRWSRSASLVTARYSHTATLLRDGRVLVVGGNDELGNALSSCEIYDPAADRFTVTAPLSRARSGQSAVLLRDGRVLVIGGAALRAGSGASLTQVEAYDPSKNRWYEMHALTVPADSNTATLLENGRILILSANDSLGGGTKAQLYDPEGATPNKAPLAQPGEPGNEGGPRMGVNHAATLLADGRVLIAGGMAGDEFAFPQTASYVFRTAFEKWQRVSDLISPRAGHTATALADGRVLVAGGWGSNGALDSVEVFDSKALAWRSLGKLRHKRLAHTATPLGGDQVLIAGGAGTGPDRIAQPETERYDVARGLALSAGNLDLPRWNHTATLLRDGSVLVIGGYDGAPLAVSERYR